MPRTLDAIRARTRGRIAAKALLLLAGVAALLLSSSCHRQGVGPWGDYRKVTYGSVLVGSRGVPPIRVTAFPARFLHTVRHRRLGATYPHYTFEFSPGVYLARVETDRPAVLKVWTYGPTLEEAGGFDLISPVCMYFCVGKDVCGGRVETDIPELYLGVAPVDGPPEWISVTIERATAKMKLGPLRWTCPEAAAPGIGG